MEPRLKIGKARGTALIVIGIVMGAMLIEPAVAHLTTFSHLKEHFYTKKAANKKFGKLVAAGVHTSRPLASTDPPVIDRSFNNVNDADPAISGTGGSYLIDMGFNVENRYVVCSIDTNYVDTRDALCTTSTPGGNNVRVRVWDTGTDSGPAEQRNAEFWVLVYGPGV